MKYTEEFFEFPIRIYDGYSLVNAEIEEEKQVMEGNEASPLPVAFVVGVKALRPEDICEWMDVYSKDHDIDVVREAGFPCTLVTNKNGDAWECNWPRKKFKEKLDDFMEQLREKQKTKLL